MAARPSDADRRSSAPAGDTTLAPGAGDSIPATSSPRPEQPWTAPHPESLVGLPAELRDHPIYEVHKELGRGGMGVVYLARNKVMDRLEVLKVIQEQIAGRPKLFQRFAKEIQMAARLQHPNIVIAYSAFPAGNTLVLAMEYVEGNSLHDVVVRMGPLSVAHACAFARQVALGLQLAHEKGMVHRDIKPANLMLSREGQVKILDFGLAKLASEQAAREHAESVLTPTGAMMGTPAYMPPEQALDARSADICADVYSLGCTLFFLLTGRPPFVGRSPYEVMHAHQTQQPPLLGAMRPGAPEGLAALVERMLAKRPADRPTVPGEVAKALVPFLKGTDQGDEALKAREKKDGPAPVKERKEPRREIVNSVGMRLARIPAGTFLMGSPEGEKGRSDGEGPQHEVAISRPFWMGVFPVTVGQFRAFVQARNYKTEAERSGGAYGWTGSEWKEDPRFNWMGPGFEQGETCPVTCVSWNDAGEFLKWLNGLKEEQRAGRLYRLPSEAQWEYSCRGGAASYQVFHFGNSLASTQANFDGNYPYGGAPEGEWRRRTTPIDTFAPNAFGLQDMHGNVWEWCADWFGSDYYKNSPRVDPPGPGQDSLRVFRGGSWDAYGRDCRSAYRNRYAPSFRGNFLGFRASLVSSGGKE